MKPAEIATVVVAIPVIVALFAAEVAASRTPAPVAGATQSQREQTVSSANFDEIVVSAKRTTKG